MPVPVPSEGSVPHTLAELKRLRHYASVSSSVKWDLQSPLPQRLITRTALANKCSINTHFSY